MAPVQVNRTVAASAGPVGLDTSTESRRRCSVLRVGAGLLALGVAALGIALLPSAGSGTVGTGLAWLGWLVGVALLLLAAAEAFELVELTVHTPSEAGERPAGSDVEPFVSFHLPICAEPPELVARTLLALRALHHDRFEVLVVDNNTDDTALWRPIERLCRELGPRFRFFHLPRWPGYKAGALNFALAHTMPEASVVAVIDCDYEVAPEFVADLVGHFADARVAFVQAPQDYRDWEGQALTRMFYWEYWQFFAVSMRLRRPRNAILMHGTMVMIRKAALLGVGGWAEWCLTEDSELGLRLLAAGYCGVYCRQTYGRGLVPFSSRAYRRQRERWVTGGVQTVRRHWRLFLPWARQLTTAQKLHYLQGWAPWLRDGIIVASLPLITVLALFSLGFADTPQPVVPLSSAALTLVTYLLVRQIIVYGPYLRRPWSNWLEAGLAIFGLVPSVGRAWLRGWFATGLVFHRTPKQPQPRNTNLAGVSCELIAGLIMLMLAAGILVRFGAEGSWAAAGLGAYAALFLSSVCFEVIEQWAACGYSDRAESTAASTSSSPGRRHNRRGEPEARTGMRR
jgi:cellulose synthase/poly-beta-1,6-N-acetylglucosamine synthase-like glycosyltransferase